jgi:hypothetical protein
MGLPIILKLILITYLTFKDDGNESKFKTKENKQEA